MRTKYYHKPYIAENGEIRCLNSLQLLGYWFVQDKVKYFVPLNQNKNEIDKENLAT